MGLWVIIIGLLGLIGRYLNNRDRKRGYCDSGIPQERIDAYKNEKNVGHVMDNFSAKEIKDQEIQERTDEDDDDSQR